MMCAVGADCISGVCAGGVCTVPTCMDAVKNATETDVDCGGGCPGCALGMACLAHADCQSGTCQNGVCRL
jgi:hypothetical protein